MAFQPKALCYGIPSAETSGKKQSAVGSRQSAVKSQSSINNPKSGIRNLESLNNTKQLIVGWRISIRLHLG